MTSHVPLTLRFCASSMWFYLSTLVFMKYEFTKCECTTMKTFLTCNNYISFSFLFFKFVFGKEKKSQMLSYQQALLSPIAFVPPDVTKLEKTFKNKNRKKLETKGVPQETNHGYWFCLITGVLLQYSLSQRSHTH